MSDEVKQTSQQAESSRDKVSLQKLKQERKHAHKGMLNGKTPYIVALCVGIIAALAILCVVVEHMEVGDTIALCTGVGTIIGGLSWVYTRQGQGKSDDPTRTSGSEKGNE